MNAQKIPEYDFPALNNFSVLFTLSNFKMMIVMGWESQEGRNTRNSKRGV